MSIIYTTAPRAAAAGRAATMTPAAGGVLSERGCHHVQYLSPLSNNVHIYPDKGFANAVFRYYAQAISRIKKSDLHNQDKSVEIDSLEATL